VDVLELAHPGKPQGRRKTICALASVSVCREAVERCKCKCRCRDDRRRKLGIGGISSDGPDRRRGGTSRP
jgi:hypothetical protein